MKGGECETVHCPVNLPDLVLDNLRKWSLELFSFLKLRDYARIDYLLTDKNEISFLEINALPGLSPLYSVLPQQAEQAGFSYRDLIAAFIGNYISRNRKK